MKLVIFYLTNADRHFTFQPFVNFLNESSLKDNWELLVLTHDNDSNFYKSVLKETDIKYSIHNFGAHNNYLVKANFAADYAIQNNIPYMMKCDNDLFFKGATLDFMIEHLELLNHPSNLTLGPCLSSGIPCVEYFMDDFLNEEQRDTLKSKFLETTFKDIWGARYTHLNRFTINTPEPKIWDGEVFFREVRANEHHYKGIHPIRINLDAINYLNEQIIANKESFYKSVPTDIIRDNTSPYLCNSVYCIKASTYKDILNDQSLFVDCYDEVPLNKYAWRTNAAHLFVKNGYGIHMHYNTIPGNIEREQKFCDIFFSQ